METTARSAGGEKQGAEKGKEGEGERILLPTSWEEEDKCSLLTLSTDGLGVEFAGSAKYGDRDAAAVRSNRPIPPQCGVYYYEVEVTDKGLSGYIGIGLSHLSVKLSRLPGWEAHSWGYHGDDGRAFCCLGTGESFGPTFGTGDVVGCGVDWSGVIKEGEESMGKRGREKEGKEGGGRVFFTKNGEMLGFPFSSVHGALYPSIGLRTPGESVRVNFGGEKFRFDIDSFVRDRHRTISSSISSLSIPPSLLLPPPTPSIPSLLPPSASPTHIQERTHETLQALITSYLLHHGYTSSAEAFARQVTEERRERARGLLGPGTPSVEQEARERVEDEAALAASLTSSSDAATRAAVRAAYLRGDIPEVRRLMQEHYPEVLDAQDERGGLSFRLGVREFVGCVVAVGRSSSSSSSATSSSSLAKGKGRATDNDDIDIAMDDPSSSSPSTSSSTLDTLLSLGRQLQSSYGASPLTYVQEQLRLAFSLMAYDFSAGEEGGLDAAPEEVRRLFGGKEREREADEVNGLILQSQHLPSTPHLETLLRHTSAVYDLLGEMGEGGACLVDVGGAIRSGSD